MAASARWTPRPGPLSGRPLRVAVYRNDTLFANIDPEYLPNVKCESIQHREGASPPTAKFSYLADERARAAGWPCDFESILRLSQMAPAGAGAAKPEASARYIAAPGSRIIVKGYADGDRKGSNPRILFDGFARAPQASVGPRSQTIGFDAVGVAERLWDEPIHQVVLRAAGKPESTDADSNRWTPVRAKINPDYRSAGLDVVVGNCTPNGHDMSILADGPGGGLGWPCFIDSTYLRQGAGATAPSLWTLSRLARYLIWAHNGRMGQDEMYVKNPTPEGLDALLDSRRPKKDGGVLDPDDPASYESSPIVLPESDVTGRPWPDVLESYLSHYGFSMRFRTKAASDGSPETRLIVYRKDGSAKVPPKSIPYQRARAVLDTNRTHIAALSIGRDFGAVFNGVIVDTRLDLWEIAVVLAPAFAPQAGDSAASQRLRFLLSNLTLQGSGGVDWDRYRLWVCEEVKGPTATVGGDRKYSHAVTNDKVFDCFKIWGSDLKDKAAKEVRRRRPGRADLLSRDPLGRPLKSTLSISKDYAGPINDLWDFTGTWQAVPPGRGWRLLPDRLGIRIDCEDPDAWNVGIATYTAADNDGVVAGNGGIVKLVTSTTAPTDQNPTIFLRLTTVIEGDRRVSKPLPRRSTSPLKRSRFRFVDATNAFGQQAIHISSPYFAGPQKGDVLMARDDAKAVAAYAAQAQRASEVPPVEGTITIPWYTGAYEVGDQIGDVSGRDLSLEAGAGAEAGEGRRHPYVTAVDHEFGDSGQSTTLHISNRIAGPSLEGATG